MNELLWAQGLQWLPRLGWSLALFAAFWLVGMALKGLAGRMGRRVEVDPSVLKLVGQGLKGATLVFGAVTALGTLGVDVSALVAGLGLTGFALGFALRDALSNLLAGALILVYHPFRLHDRIKVGSFTGTVTEINLRYTVLEEEGQTILIPNATMFTHTIVILSATP